MSHPVRLMSIIVLACVMTFLLGACAYLQHPKFGAYPEGDRLERVQRSPNFADGEFHYPVATPILAEGTSTFSIITADLFRKIENLRPAHAIPAVKTDLKALDVAQDTIVWLGHSSYFVIFAGQRILIDPVLSPYASPVSFSTQAFDGTSLYAVDDMPAFDVLLITHDHWDHLDHATVTALKDKVGRVLVPLGVGAHMEYWGYARDRLREAGGEVGTTTGRPRRCGWLDLVALKYAVRLNGMTGLAMTKLDVLSGIDTLRVCVRYRGAEGAQFEEFPYHQSVLHHSSAEYEELPGFSEDISGARSESDLPDAAREYLRYISDFVGVPVTLIGVGPGREQVIWVGDQESTALKAA